MDLSYSACENEKISKREAIDIIKGLSRSDFGYGGAYDWALARLKLE